MKPQALRRLGLGGRIASLAVLLAVVACADKQTTPAGVGGACPMATVPDPCAQDSALCVRDLRVVRDRFPTCRTGNGWEPYLTSCGEYDGVVYAGIDSAMIYHFERTQGRLAGVTNIGLTTLAPCQAFVPSFHPTECDTPDPCPLPDGGGG